MSVKLAVALKTLSGNTHYLHTIEVQAGQSVVHGVLTPEPGHKLLLRNQDA